MNDKKICGLLNPKHVKYVGTYIDKSCKVDDLINSQYIVFTSVDNQFRLTLPFKYMYFVNGNIAITLLEDKLYSVWDEVNKIAINLTGDLVIKNFGLKILKK